MDDLQLIEFTDKPAMVGAGLLTLWNRYSDEPPEAFSYADFLRKIGIVVTLHNKYSHD